jgi:hypothetical protein
MPRIFQLSINYRSPGGVVNCAHSVIELLQRFPRAIDVLEREQGIISGLKPLFIHQKDRIDVEKHFFLTDKRSDIILNAFSVSTSLTKSLVLL